MAGDVSVHGVFTKTPADATTSVPAAPDAPSVALASAPGGTPPPHAGGGSDDDSRAALPRLAAGVVLIPAHAPADGPRGEAVGMTAPAFVSVSLEPPLV